MTRIFKAYRYTMSYYASNPTRMKNEPVGSYNHMQEDEQTMNSIQADPVPASLYMLLIVDAVLISALAVFAAQIIF
ncbi:MAG: hypothetical protein IPP27_10425 [Bacteroidetes bacterium]|nr:hypothetical protein [Bacteroidota bacterium]MBK8364047.1 hypothetical protein [Bacteroidota bacterium]MBK9413405.1 hypothetical protein [Bacteroidota bacterium]MBL0032562.1 hypothetical protein [Bacteroidota bacterium]MBP6656914.1 hypothetical protein [Bacteroidia bacterium]